MKKSIQALLAVLIAVLATTGAANAKFYGKTSGEAYIPLTLFSGASSTKSYTSMHITNVTNQDVTVSLAFYSIAGGIVKDTGNSASTGFLLASSAYSGTFSNYTEDPSNGESVQFTLAAGQQILIQLYSSTAPTQFGYGKISWISTPEVGSALMVMGYMVDSGTSVLNTNPIPINGGMPF